ncbi:MAG: IS21 family transposase [Actinomycetota bacterium]
MRRDSREEGLSVRGLAERHQVHRRAVRQALASPLPPGRRTPERAAPALGPHKATIRTWLLEDQGAPAKQRHTSRRIWQRLVTEHGAQVAESTVRAYVAGCRRQIGDQRAVVTIAQTHTPGEEAEVDFGELHAFIDGVDTKLWMFVMRLSASGRALHVAFATQAQEAFFEGHIAAFEHFCGVPHRIRYDNLKAAVTRVLLGRGRIENERFITLRSHYGFDSFFCIPGKQGAHEKGGVEGEIGRFRRTHLVPVPQVSTLGELNARIGAADLTDDTRIITGRTTSVGEAFALERPALRVLPAEPFDAATILSCRVDYKARICVRQSFYSVPAHLARSVLTVHLYPHRLEVLSSGRIVARHERAVHRGTISLVLDHYLEVLGRRPGAMAGSVALNQARASGAFTSTHERFWASARQRLGDAGGTRALIDVLLLQRAMGPDAVIAGMTATLSAGICDPEIVAVEARRSQRPVSPADTAITRPSSAERPAPSLHGYDELLVNAGAR